MISTTENNKGREHKHVLVLNSAVLMGQRVRLVVGCFPSEGGNPQDTLRRLARDAGIPCDSLTVISATIEPTSLREDPRFRHSLRLMRSQYEAWKFRVDGEEDWAIFLQLYAALRRSGVVLPAHEVESIDNYIRYTRAYRCLEEEDGDLTNILQEVLNVD